MFLRLIKGLKTWLVTTPHVPTPTPFYVTYAPNKPLKVMTQMLPNNEGNKLKRSIALMLQQNF